MARVTAAVLRARAREALLACGGRGFVRFLEAGDALLVTDAIRRCTGEREKASLAAALLAAGFACGERDGLLHITPMDELLMQIDAPAVRPINWESPLHPARALAMRWTKNARQMLTAAGRQIVRDALRLTWQDRAHVLAGLDALRAQAAIMQRNRDTSGLYEAGAILMNWCDDEEGTGHEA